jgi:hypothetical protein
MGEIGSHYRIIHEEKEYECGGDLPEYRHRCMLYGGSHPDILIKQSNGKYQKITGICIGGFDIPDEDIKYVEKDNNHLYMM